MPKKKGRAHRKLSDRSVVRAKADRPERSVRYSQAGGSHACIASSTTRHRRYRPAASNAATAEHRVPEYPSASPAWLAQLTRDRGWYVRMASLEQTAFESVSPCAQARNAIRRSRTDSLFTAAPARVRRRHSAHSRLRCAHPLRAMDRFPHLNPGCTVWYGCRPVLPSAQARVTSTTSGSAGLLLLPMSPPADGGGAASAGSALHSQARADVRRCEQDHAPLAFSDVTAEEARALSPSAVRLRWRSGGPSVVGRRCCVDSRQGIPCSAA